LDEKSIFKTIKFAYGKFNNIDMAINCMGVFNYDIIKNINYNSLVKCFKINALSIFIINKYFAKNKIKKKYLKIISLGSSSAFDGYKDTISYCGSKHALLGIIRSLNKTLYKKRIINYCLSTGSLKNRMGRKVKNANFEEFIEQKEVIKTISYIYDLDVRGVPQEIFIKRC
jgi:NADP-dependent 3-hydroxy acid dehydrogenase YdfG